MRKKNIKSSKIVNNYLGNIVDIKMGQSPPSKFYNNRGEGLPFFQGVKDFGGRIPTPSVYCSNPAKLASKGDVLFSVRAPVGEVNLATKKSCIGRGVAALTANDGINNYLYYLLKANKNYIRTYSGGTTYESINKDTLKNIKLNIHKEKEQREEVADILSTYDDLIENNNRRIEILEEMAQAIYKEWFVNFRFPGHENTKFIDSGTEFGKIPEGWEAVKLNDIVELLSGFSFKSKDFTKKGKYKVITIKSVHDGVFKPDNSSLVKKIPPNMPQHCNLNRGDILLSLTGNAGRVCFAYGENLLLNQRVAKIRSKSFSNSFVYCLFRNENLKNRLINLATGAAQQNLSPIKAGNLQVVKPNKGMNEMFGKIVNPILKEVVVLNEQNQKLRQARDSLLPKLINGKIEINNKV